MGRAHNFPAERAAAKGKGHPVRIREVLGAPQAPPELEKGEKERSFPFPRQGTLLRRTKAFEKTPLNELLKVGREHAVTECASAEKWYPQAFGTIPEIQGMLAEECHFPPPEPFVLFRILGIAHERLQGISEKERVEDEDCEAVPVGPLIWGFPAHDHFRSHEGHHSRNLRREKPRNHKAVKVNEHRKTLADIHQEVAKMEIGMGTSLPVERRYGSGNAVGHLEVVEPVCPFFHCPLEFPGTEDVIDELSKRGAGDSFRHHSNPPPPVNFSHQRHRPAKKTGLFPQVLA
jgi:hypothetical protein